MDKTQLLHTIRYNACQIKIEAVATSATLDNYDYLLNLSLRMDAIERCILSIGKEFANEPAANLVSNSIHRAMVALIPSFGLGDFDWAGAGETLSGWCCVHTTFFKPVMKMVWRKVCAIDTIYL